MQPEKYDADVYTAGVVPTITVDTLIWSPAEQYLIAEHDLEPPAPAGARESLAPITSEPLYKNTDIEVICAAD
jgi:hypothetical protein